MDSLNRSLKNTLTVGIANNSIALLVLLYIEYLMQTRGEATGEGMLYAFSLFPIQLIIGILNILLLLRFINSIVFEYKSVMEKLNVKYLSIYISSIALIILLMSVSDHL